MSRLVAVYDGTCCTDDFYVVETDAPEERLKELEEQCKELVRGGCSEDEIPEWANVLAEEGYSFDYVDGCDNPYAKEWMESEYPDITEIYTKHYPVSDGESYRIPQY